MSEAPSILLADDDADDREFIEEALGEVGPERSLCWVRDGRALLDALESWPEATLPLVLLDLNMPRMGGLEALLRIRADASMRTVPVVVFTTSDEEGDVRAAYSAGANAYLVKPSSFEQLLKLMRDVHAFWLNAAQLPPRP